MWLRGGDAFRGAAFHGGLPAARPSAEEALARGWDASASSRIGGVYLFALRKRSR
jgi:hypothetical protein